MGKVSFILLFVVRRTSSANVWMDVVKGKTKATEEDDEEEELRKLQAEMAM